MNKSWKSYLQSENVNTIFEMKISIHKNKKPKQIWYQVLRGEGTPKGAPLDGWFRVRS